MNEECQPKCSAPHGIPHCNLVHHLHHPMYFIQGVFIAGQSESNVTPKTLRRFMIAFSRGRRRRRLKQNYSRLCGEVSSISIFYAMAVAQDIYGLAERQAQGFL